MRGDAAWRARGHAAKARACSSQGSPHGQAAKARACPHGQAAKAKAAPMGRQPRPRHACVHVAMALAMAAPMGRQPRPRHAAKALACLRGHAGMPTIVSPNSFAEMVVCSLMFMISIINTMMSLVKPPFG